jgi:membrane-associated phospholipid phosphatase
MANFPMPYMMECWLRRVVMVFLALIIFLKSAGQNIDIDLLKKIHVDRDRSLDPTFEIVTRSVTPMVLAVPAGYLTHALIKKDSLSRSRAIAITSSVVVAGILSTSLKYAVGKDRPYETYAVIDNVTSDFTPTFPSGHTTFAFALATSVSIDYPKWYVVLPSFVWAGAVGYSRMHLGVHYPSDVLIGAVIGTGSAIATRRLTKWVQGRYYRKNRRD